MEEQKHEILLGLTTTPHSNWREKIQEMKKFGIKKIALFPTFLNIDERRELYELLAEIEDLEIPHVHLRNQDMEAWEMELFEKKYKTEVYNIHTNAELTKCLSKYMSSIFIENHFKMFNEKHLAGFGGICLDVQHLKRSKMEAPKVHAQMVKLMKNNTVGCCHVSAFPKLRYMLGRLLKKAGGHYMIGLSELDYVGQYRQYLPYYISLELENSFMEQLEAKNHLEKILNFI